MTALFSIIAALVFFMFSCGDQKPMQVEKDSSAGQVSAANELGDVRKPQVEKERY
jgi:hypothetical protein